MKALKVIPVLAVLLLLSVIQLHADEITVYVGAGRATFVANPGGGQSITFSGLRLFTSDSSANTQVTISPGAAGSFLFTSVSGGRGYFAPLNGATFSMGDATSGIVSGSLTSIQIIGASVGNSLTSFTIQLTFNNIDFQGCSTIGCVNSDTLQQFAAAGSGTALINVSFQNSTANSLDQLLAMTGTHTSSASGQFDATVTPEPASLALFGTGLLLVGLRIGRHAKKKSKDADLR